MTLIERLLNGYMRLLEAVIAACLLLMVLLVFGNVVLRYGFNSGITVSEEISRWLFIWLTFLGALIGLREHAHLGTDALIARLGPGGKKVCLFIAHALMLVICWMLFRGSLEQTKINWDVSAPSSGASMAWFYSVGIVFSASAAMVTLLDLWKLVSGRTGDDELSLASDHEAAA
jgi:TRAP-type C4-dicarboxylate transport system permease small subunit